MFTGIIENVGNILSVTEEESNLHLTIESLISNHLQIDQSINHNGICLTVVKTDYKKSYVVTAIQETILKSTVERWRVGTLVNLERAMSSTGRFDGHIVQGHVDQIGQCISKNFTNGSWIFSFEYNPSLGNITVEKGSITVNGVSLTVINSEENKFSVAIIPYTYEHTNFKTLETGDNVNLEFDILGKYILNYMKRLNTKSFSIK